MAGVPAALVRLMPRPRLGAVKLGPEDRIGIEFANRLRAWTLEGRLTAVWSHVGNEVGGGRGYKSVIAYTIAKALGLVTGMSDYFFIWPGGGALLELKAAAGRQTEAQRDVEAWCEFVGIPYRVCRSADEGEAILREWGVLK